MDLRQKRGLLRGIGKQFGQLAELKAGQQGNLAADAGNVSGADLSCEGGKIDVHR